MYLHGHFYNQKEERIEVHILTGGDRTKETVIGEKNGELSFTDDPVDLTSQVNDLPAGYCTPSGAELCPGLLLCLMP